MWCWGCSWACREMEEDVSSRKWKWKFCLTLATAMDYSVHGILQARILEWVAFPFSRASPQPRDWTQVSSIAGGFFTNWAIRGIQQRRQKAANSKPWSETEQNRAGAEARSTWAFFSPLGTLRNHKRIFKKKVTWSDFCLQRLPWL